jgi:hypothetical protein
MEYRHSFHESLPLPADLEENAVGMEETAAAGGVLGSSFEVEPSDRPRKTLRLSSSCSSLVVYR